MAKKVNRRAMKTYEAWYDYTNFFGKQEHKFLGTISARSEYEAKLMADSTFEWDRSNPTCIIKHYPDSIRVKRTR